jgi:hypothetical protein
VRPFQAAATAWDDARPVPVARQNVGDVQEISDSGSVPVPTRSSVWPRTGLADELSWPAVPEASQEGSAP